MSKSSSVVYFQKQSTFDNSCGVCALNNLMGEKMFTKQFLNEVCSNFSDSFINPYKSIFGGDFDVTALISALECFEVNVRWLKRDESFEEITKSEKLIGFLLNSETKRFKILAKIFQQSGRHWTCLARKGKNFVYMDSTKDEPSEFQNSEEANRILELFRESGGIVLILESGLNKEEYEMKELNIKNKSFIEFEDETY